MGFQKYLYTEYKPGSSRNLDGPAGVSPLILHRHPYRIARIFRQLAPRRHRTPYGFPLSLMYFGWVEATEKRVT
ncbi:hypothetical protein W02_14670 [Nitrospira sp. KM1]|nr:hypothetical protein W02_14670 [Nitrospira sp. KM1]